MNGLVYLATVKCFEARDKLRAAQAAVETLAELGVLPGLKPELEALLEALEGHAATLEAYTRTLNDMRLYDEIVKHSGMKEPPVVVDITDVARDHFLLMPPADQRISTSYPLLRCPWPSAFFEYWTTATITTVEGERLAFLPNCRAGIHVTTEPTSYLHLHQEAAEALRRGPQFKVPENYAQPARAPAHS